MAYGWGCTKSGRPSLFAVSLPRVQKISHAFDETFDQFSRSWIDSIIRIQLDRQGLFLNLIFLELIPVIVPSWKHFLPPRADYGEL